MNHQKWPEVTRLKVPIHDVVDRGQILGDKLSEGATEWSFAHPIINSSWLLAPANLKPET